MATATLNATARSTTGKGAARKLRGAQQIPGVVYGHGRSPQPLTIDLRDLQKLLDRYSADTTVVELSIDGTTARTLIRDIQRHPYRPQILHVDFQELVAGELVTIDLPIHLIGTPNGVRVDGGMLDQVLREITIEVDPSNIPSHVELDVTALEINDSLHVSDLKLPDGVTVLTELEQTVCVVAPPRVEEEPAPVAVEGEEAVAEPELIRKPKEEEEGGEGES
ncbi:MAG TPA: 50S ribosomal protein L25/general stress protein Ctc [Gemmatimonadaceae bacterium]|nr:50S ribosomal protein L25/general stress protein Ctc [Gemmatimonadaceae bacterium]